MKNIIVRRSRIMLLLSLVLLWAKPATAQILSSEYAFSNCSGSEVIVRSTLQGQLLMHYKKTGTNMHYFALRNPSYSTANQAIITPYTTPHGTVKYIVNDMCVIGNMCYFCGQKGTPTGNNIYHIGVGWSAEYEYVGFVGRFTLSLFGIHDPSAAKYGIIEISNTSTLNRMDYFVDNNDTLLGFVGLSDENPSHTCIVRLRSNQYGGRQYSRYNVEKSTDENEIFTDVVVAEKRLAFISKKAGDNWLLYIRNGSRDNWKVSDLYEFNQRYCFNTQLATAPLGDALLWRRTDADIRACCIPYADEVNVAHECNSYGPSSSTHYSSALFKISLGTNVSMISAQYVSGAYQNPNCLKDIAYLPCDQTVAILYSNPINTNLPSVIFLPSWNSSSPTNSMTIIDKAISTITVNNNQELFMGGVNTGTSELTQLTQDKPAIDVWGNLCQRHNTTSFLELSTVSANMDTSSLVMDVSASATWSTYVLESDAENLDDICIF